MKIDGVPIREPSNLIVTTYKTRKVRVMANGRITVENIADRKAIEAHWEHIAGPEYQQILDLLSTGAFHELTYTDPQGGEAHTIIVCVDDDGRIPGTRWLKRGTRYWKGVQVRFLA